MAEILMALLLIGLNVGLYLTFVFGSKRWQYWFYALSAIIIIPWLLFEGPYSNVMIISASLFIFYAMGYIAFYRILFKAFEEWSPKVFENGKRGVEFLLLPIYTLITTLIELKILF